VCEYPIGHKRRRAEGMPILVEKFKTNLARRFPERQRKTILEACMDPARLEAMPVNQFVDLFVI
jgi:2-methylcitrate dehydratase